MAKSSILITPSCLPTPRPFAFSSVPLQFHVKPPLSRTTTTNGNVLPSSFIIRRTTPLESRNNIIKATADQFGDETQIQLQPKSMNLIELLFTYTRPYVFFSTVFGLGGAVARIWMQNSHLVQASNWLQLSSTTFMVLLAMVSTDGFISQINNIADVAIDKINKPKQALATKAIISRKAAWVLVVGSTVLSIGIAAFLKSKAFLAFIVLHLAFGVIYSAPPFNTKRSTYGASLTIASLRGYTDTFLMCSGAAITLGLPFQLSPPVVFLAIFNTVFSLAVGIMKDIPDIKGDTIHKVPTIASTYGAKFAAYAGFGFMLIAYIGAIAAGFLYPNMFNQKVMVSAHLAILHWVAFEAWKLNKENYNKEASESFYGKMWGLLVLESIIFPFI